MAGGRCDGKAPASCHDSAAASVIETGAALIRSIELGKTFRTARGLAALRVDLSGRGRLLRYRPGRISAVDSVTLSIAPGEVVGLIGESGSGKSTLGRLLLRLIEPSVGRVEFAGADIQSLSKHRLRHFRQTAQIVFQNADSSLNPRLSVGATLKRPLILFGRVAPSAREARVIELLEMVRLPGDYRRRYPHQLSGGEKQFGLSDLPRRPYSHSFAGGYHSKTPNLDHTAHYPSANDADRRHAFGAVPKLPSPGAAARMRERALYPDRTVLLLHRLPHRT